MKRILLLPLLAALLVPLACSEDESPTTPKPAPAIPMTLVAADQAGDVYVVNPTTGATTLGIETSTKNSTGADVDVGVVSSMLYISQTGKWWLGTGGNAECAGCIQTLDPATGMATKLNNTIGGNRGVSGLARQSSNGKIYTFESDGTQSMYEINATTGTFTEIHNTLSLDNSGKGTTFSNSGTLYVAAGDHLYSVDPATGDVSDIGLMSLSGFPVISRYSIGSLATRTSDGAVFGILKDGGGGGNTTATYLVRIDLATAQVTNVGNMNGNFDGLAYVPTSLLPV